MTKSIDYKMQEKKKNELPIIESTEMPEYTGQWANGERHGEGTLMDESGTPIFFGNWHFNEPAN